MSPQRDTAYTGIDNLEVMTGARNYNAYLVDLVARDRGECEELVDFGAGSGTYARMLMDRGYTVTCIEPDATLAEKLAHDGLQVSDSIARMSGIEYLYTLNVLEHIEDDSAAVREIFNRMAPGGRVFAYVPAFMVLYTAMDKKVGHFRRYSRRQLADLFEQAGFVVDDVRYADSLGYFVTLLFKWVGNRKGDVNVRGLGLYDRFVFPVSRVLDYLASTFFGKNVMIRAHKP
jgi:SAM-dependent methyltransferase